MGEAITPICQFLELGETPMEETLIAPDRIPAVAYLRRSTNRQERSLEDQRREIEAYAQQRGYRVLRWYSDSGISGDATERRAEFLKMHQAATNSRDFDVILCWDYSRFGRFDSIEA